jgi:hypothetical protein
MKLKRYVKHEIKKICKTKNIYIYLVDLTVRTNGSRIVAAEYQWCGFSNPAEG